MKKVTIGISVFMCIYLFTLIGCHKYSSENKIDESSKSISLRNQALIAKAKIYFENEVQSTKTSSEQFYGKRTPVWQEAITSQHNGNEIIVVPLKYEKDISLKFNWDGNSSYRLKDNSHLYITLGKNPTAKVKTEIPGANLKGSHLKIVEYDLIEDWAGNTIDKILVTDKGPFRINLTKNNNVTRLNSSDCTYIVWSICDYVNGMTSNCEYVGTSTVGCDEQFLNPGDGGGENLDRTGAIIVRLKPGVPNNDSIGVQASWYIHGSYGLFDNGYYEGAIPVKMVTTSYSFQEGGHDFQIRNDLPGHQVYTSFSGSITSLEPSDPSSYPVGISKYYTYAQAFNL